MDVNNQNLSNEEKDNAMKSAMNVLSKLGIKVSPETEKIMNSFLDGNISQKDAMKQAKENAKNQKNLE